MDRSPRTNGRVVAAAVLGIALVGPRVVRAQDAGAAPVLVVPVGFHITSVTLPDGAPGTAGAPVAPSAEPALPPGHPVVATDTPGELPPGHPGVGNAGGTGMEQLPNFRQVPLPETFATEAPDLPPGVVLVRVVDAQGGPQSGLTVHMGALREGERQGGVDLPTRWDGVAQFEHLSVGSNVAYRATVQFGGARYSSTPFQLPSNNGYRVQLVRYDTDPDPRSVLISDARVEIAFQDDRFAIAQHSSIVNFSNMSLTGQSPHPIAFVPREGLRFGLPTGASAFRVDEQSMGDQRVTEEAGEAVLRGSIPPTGAQSAIPIAFQYRVRITGTEATLELTLPLPVLRATVVAQAPQGMRLEVSGMPPAEERVHQGQRILITGRERQSREDVPIDTIRIHLSNLPSIAGPERAIAAGAAGSIAVFGLFAGVRNRTRRAPGGRSAASLEAERDRWLAEANALQRAHALGDVGPETYARRRRAIATALAAVLQQLDALKSAAKTKRRPVEK